jgi:hypothetical protein
MHKVVVERPRSGSRSKSRKWGMRLNYAPDCECEDSPMRVSSGRVRQYGWKHRRFTDVLNPLERFLRSNVGRPWDKVYSELRQGLDVRKVTGQHIFDHLQGMVEVDTFLGGEGHVFSCKWGWLGKVQGFYVHPRTGLLLWAERDSSAERKRKSLLRKRLHGFWIDGTRAYRLIEGIWYVVTHKRVSVPWVYRRPMPQLPEVWDVAQRANVRLEMGENWIATEKHQCNRAELATVRELVARWERILRRPKLEIDPELRVILAG